MAPPASRRLTSSRSFDRIEGESPKAYEAFVTYRDMGPGRTLQATIGALGKVAGYSRVLEEWSSDWNWVERAAHWDEMIELRAREVADGYLSVWEQRRQVALDRMFYLSSKLMQRVETMMDHPLTKEVTRETDGGRIIYQIIEPASWNWSAIATVFRTVVESQAAIIAEGLAEDEIENFDVESATEDQLREFLARQKRRNALKAQSH